MRTPDCSICKIKFEKMEYLNIHMKNIHQESDNDRKNRLELLIQESTNSGKIVKDFSCSECRHTFKNCDEQNRHNKEVHGWNTTKELTEFVCELCERSFSNQVTMSNHKLFMHTVKTGKMRCDYCGELCEGLKNMCKHISNKHSELFPKQVDRGNQCNMCYKRFNTSQALTKHMDEIHSPNSFYEKLKEEISGLCCKCGQSFEANEMEEHFKKNHSDITTNKEDQMKSVLSTIGEDSGEFEVVQPQVKTEEFEDYSKTTHDENEPKLITLRGSSPDFLEARRVITRIMRRSNLQKSHLRVNDTKFKVKNLQNKIYSTEADVETIDENGSKGQCKLTIYKDNKKKAGKKDQTIMISKKARNDSKHVEILSKNVIQFLVEGLIRKEINEEDVTLDSGSVDMGKHNCNICDKKFDTLQGCLVHKGRIHGIKQKKHACVVCGEEQATEATLSAHIEFKHEKGLKRNLSEMRTNQKGYNKNHVCPKCEVQFNCENDLMTHMSKHSTSPPHKKQKNDSEEATPNKVEQEKAIRSAEPVPENLDEEMGDLKDPEDYLKEVQKNKPNKNPENLDEAMGDLGDPEDPVNKSTDTNQDALVETTKDEAEECFELISNLHECREEQFRLRYETMRRLKEEKNNQIESLQKGHDT